MKSSTRNALLAAVDVALGFAVFGLLPFGWILRDGLGPDSVSTTGVAAVWKTLMTFYVGPIILLFAVCDLILRRAGKRD